MLNYRTYCGKCNKYVFMGDLVTCGQGSDCYLKGNPKIEEIPLDFDRTNDTKPVNYQDILRDSQIQAGFHKSLLAQTEASPGPDDNQQSPAAATSTQVGGDHYASQAIQPIHYIFENNLGFCEGNVIKYVTRYQKKNGVEDLKKARHYLDMLIERLEVSK